jgi:hypothetical protein
MAYLFPYVNPRAMSATSTAAGQGQNRPQQAVAHEQSGPPFLRRIRIMQSNTPLPLDPNDRVINEQFDSSRGMWELLVLRESESPVFTGLRTSFSGYSA